MFLFENLVGKWWKNWKLFQNLFFYYPIIHCARDSSSLACNHGHSSTKIWKIKLFKYFFHAFSFRFFFFQYVCVDVVSLFFEIIPQETRSDNVFGGKNVIWTFRMRLKLSMTVFFLVFELWSISWAGIFRNYVTWGLWQ